MNDNYIHFPFDLCRDNGPYSLFDGKYYSRDAILELLRNADILVFDTYDRFFAWDILFEDYYIGKKVVYRHNGDQFRLNGHIAGSFHRRNNDAIVCSTPDLLRVDPRIKKQTWMPNVPIDEKYLNVLQLPFYDEPLVVGHAPTNSARKGTKDFLRALDKVDNKELVDIDFTDRSAWYTAVAHRAVTHHVYFDQLQEDISWYGNSSVEAAWLGQIVFCNKLLEGYAEVPFVTFTADTMKQVLNEFFDNINESMYYDMSDEHIDWAKTFHDPKRLAPIHAKWMIENATEWKDGHRYNADVILAAMGYRWDMGKGVKL
jgi:hypothetical protein